MGTVLGYLCNECGYEFEIGETQPYWVFAGEIVDKYCPHTEEIIHVLTTLSGEVKITCQNKDWQEEFGDPEHCKGCDSSCLKSLDPPGDLLICPRCGKEIGKQGLISISEVD